MGVDLRRGKQDTFNRYYVYSTKGDLNLLQHDPNFVGVIHAKDVTAYTMSKQTNMMFQTQNMTAQIITYDVITIKPNYYLYSIEEKNWYVVDMVNEDSVNTTQECSCRPLIERTISIRKSA